ncbi:hypothetical protein LCGC14_1506640, partial [marine sediment metagenome]
MPSSQRQAATAALAELFRPSTPRGRLPILLAVSILAHGALLPLVLRAKTAPEGLSAGEDSYLSKVMQKERARKISRQIKDRMTMPPPPPDPASVIQNTLETTLSEDISRVVGNLLDVDVTSRLADRVKASLAQELQAASKNIAAGRLSAEEIAALFRAKAHEKTLQELRVYRIETQEERAQLSTIDWYTKSVAPALFNNMSFHLFNPPGYRGWPPSPKMWRHVFPWPAWPGHYQPWEYCLKYKVRALADELLKGKTVKRDPKTRKRYNAIHDFYPGPNLQQAEHVLAKLHAVYDLQLDPKRKTLQRAGEPWKDVIWGGKYHHGLINDLYVHEPEVFRAKAEPVDATWVKAFDTARRYVELAEAGAAEERLKAAQKACFDLVRQLVDAIPRLLPSDRVKIKGVRYNDLRDRVYVNHVTHMEVLRSPGRKEVYKLLIDRLHEELSPLIRDYAEGQFDKGMIVQKAGLAKVMEEFARQVLPKLRQHIEMLIPARAFDGVVHMPYQYEDPITGFSGPPSDEQFEDACKKMAAILARRPDLKPYARKRRELHRKYFREAVNKVVEALMTEFYTGKLLRKAQGKFIEGVDYADKVKERLDAREAARRGRGQDLAELTAEGVPDTNAAKVALLWGGAKGHGASLQPVVTKMTPGYFTGLASASALRFTTPQFAPKPARWDF